MKGPREDDIGFLEWVLEPNPDIRPTSIQIWESGWLEIDDQADSDDLVEIQRAGMFEKKKA